MPAVQFPTGFFPNPDAAGVIGLGYVYIGGVGLNPRVLANRISVTIIEEDGSEVVIPAASQPFQLTAGGVFTYNGSPVRLTVATDYSMAIDTVNNVQAFYFPNVAGGDSTIVSTVILPVLDNDPAPIAGSGQLYTLLTGGIAELFYMDSAGNIIQFTEGGQLKLDLPDTILDVLAVTAAGESYGGYFTGGAIEVTIDTGVLSIDWHAAQYFHYTNTEAHVIEFSNQPIISDGKGQTIMLIIEDYDAFGFSLDPGAGYTVYRRSTDDFSDGTGLCFLICTVYETGIVAVVPLYDFVPNV